MTPVMSCSALARIVAKLAGVLSTDPVGDVPAHCREAGQDAALPTQ